MPFFPGIPGGINRRSFMRTGNADNSAQQPTDNSPYGQIGGITTSSLNPYIQRGNEAYANHSPDQVLSDMLLSNAGDWRNVYDRGFPNQYAEDLAQPEHTQMARNPADFLDNIMRRYTPSEGYRYRQNQASGEARNTAAAGGRVGTWQDQQQRADMVRQLMGQDQQEYLRNVLGIQGEGLAARERAGTEQRRGMTEFGTRQLEGTERFQNNMMAGKNDARRLLAQLLGNRNESREARGYGASENLVQVLSENIMNQERMRVMRERQQREQEQAEREQKSNKKRGRMSFLGQLGGAAAGGFLGGPSGASAGASAGRSLGGLF